jgi:hypothetical protein
MIKNIIPKAKKELGVELLDKFENAIKKWFTRFICK